MSQYVPPQPAAADGMRARAAVRGAACALAVVLVAVAALRPLAADTLFVYKRADGSRLITDHPRHDPGYRLVKQYRIGERGLEPMSATAKAPPRRASRSKPSQFDALIERTASAHGVDTALVKAMVQVESAFDPYAVSHKGAYGLMQLMPETARRYGVVDPADPVQNVRGGVRYLRHLMRLFGDDTRLALAAYNAGENAVKRYGGIPPYDETRNYVRKVMALQRRYALR